MENVAKECTFAFGDDVNDIPMFNAVGYGIAMGNADEKLKETADEITATNENDGVAQVIDRFMINIDENLMRNIG